MSVGFSGIQSAHFDAYEEKKWSSNRFNLERMRSRELLEGLCRGVVEALQSEGAALRWTSTPDHPSIFNNHRVDTQLVLVLRSEEEQRRVQRLLDRATSVAEKLSDPLPHHQQAVVYLRLDDQRFEVACRLHSNAHLDRENFARRLAVEGEQQKLRELLVALPEGVQVSVVADELMDVSACSTEHMEQLQTFVESGHDWIVGQFFDRGDERIQGADFGDVVAHLIRALWPVYQFVAWSSGVDYVDGQTYLDEHRKGGDSEVLESKKEETASAPEAAAPQPSPRKSSSYRPDWQAPAQRSERQKGPMGPSAKARLRKQEEAQRRIELERQRAEQEARDRGRGASREETPASTPRDGGGKRSSDRAHRKQDGRRPSHGNRPQKFGKHSKNRPHRDERNRSGGQKRRKAPKTVRWVEADGDIALMDHARLSGGLFNGKVGQIVEISKKGRLKVVIGDMAFDVEPSQATRVKPE